MTSKSKKILKVIDGLRAWNLAASVSTSSHKSGLDVKEILKSDHFQLGTVRLDTNFCNKFNLDCELWLSL